MNALIAIFLGLPAARTLRILRVCGLSAVLAAGPAMAGGTASGSFTVGIRVQSTPSAALTPDQLNARNKMLYEEQKKAESVTSRSDAPDPAATPKPASQATRVAP